MRKSGLILLFFADFHAGLKAFDANYNKNFVDFLKTVDTLLPEIRVFDYIRYSDVDPKPSAKGICLMLAEKPSPEGGLGKIQARIPTRVIFLDGLRKELKDWSHSPREQL